MFQSFQTKQSDIYMHDLNILIKDCVHEFFNKSTRKRKLHVETTSNKKKKY